jgi:hypothetical protein
MAVRRFLGLTGTARYHALAAIAAPKIRRSHSAWTERGVKAVRSVVWTRG